MKQVKGIPASALNLHLLLAWQITSFQPQANPLPPTKCLQLINVKQQQSPEVEGGRLIGGQDTRRAAGEPLPEGCTQRRNIQAKGAGAQGWGTQDRTAFRTPEQGTI